MGTVNTETSAIDHQRAASSGATTPSRDGDTTVADLDLARRLRDAGLEWHPRHGDRFVIPDRDMDDESFLVAPMVVEVRDVAASRLIAFNGTTEWALDSLIISEVVWLPGETALRHALGEHFRALRRDGDEWVVEVTHGTGGDAEVRARDGVEALGEALLLVLQGA